MEDEGYMAVICAILYDTEDDEKEKARRAELLEHLREAHAITTQKHEQLLAQCLHMLRYHLEVIAHLPPTETMVLYLFSEEVCKQYVANTEEIYKFEVGDHSNFKLKFAIARFNGKSHKTIVRSGSIIKRLMQIDRREDECIQISQLPIGNLVKKTISLKGRQYAVELKLLKTIDHESMPVLNFHDLLELTRALHEYDAEIMEGGYSGELSDRSFALLHRSAQFSNIPPEVIKIATLSTFLVWDTSKAILDHDSIPRLIKQLKEQQKVKKSIILDTALAHLAECVIAELHEILNQHDDKQLFPPEGYSILKSLNDSLKTVVEICVLPIWDLSTSDPTSVLTRELRQLVKNSAERWAEQEFSSDNEGEKDVCKKIHTMWELLHNHQSYSLFFSQFNINYVGVVLETVDERIETFTKDYLSKWLSALDSRQGEELEKFTKYTMRLYDTLHLLTVFGKRNKVEILRVYDFEEWFSNSTVFWTYSWRDISLKMVARTISLNNDGDETKYEHHRPLPGGLYSFLCIQKGLSDDYTMLAFRRPENLLMGSIALVHIYAENIYAYAKKLHADALSSDCDTDSRIMRAVNGIEQALLFISERWRRFVNFDRLAAVLSENETEAISTSCLNVLESTRKRCEQIMYALLRVHSRTKREDILKIAKSITVDSHEQSKTLAMYMREISPAERIHAVLDNVDRLASDVKGEFLHRCAQISLEILHNRLEKQVSRQLKRCHSPDYYSEVYIVMKAIHTILDIPPETSNLTSLLHLYSFTTNELILSYYAKVVEGVHMKKDDEVPHISIQIGYMPTSGENALILLNVVSLDGLPELNTFRNRIEPFVRIELLPISLYPPPCFPLYKTSTLSHCEESTWNQTFQFLVPQQLFYTYGSSLCISVMDHDRICDQLIGRTFLATNQLPRIETLSVSKLPDAQQLPLVQPSDIHHQPYYKLLKERSAYDKTAKAFLRREKVAKEMYLKCITRRLSTRFRSTKKSSS
ncbi:unnamed protein product [Cylicocyclus nassatus]|uniref:C2 domain-containing protein n=1 Tax=Cylicocyclus nassatus TaxID=53992 RepID=A0AA36DTA8_CYLNA|nr:unnamed protein product [Cylicocyclus nassatus]